MCGVNTVHQCPWYSCKPDSKRQETEDFERKSLFTYKEPKSPDRAWSLDSSCDQLPFGSYMKGFSWISRTGEGLWGFLSCVESFGVFFSPPSLTSQTDWKYGRFRICVWAELIESLKNIAALTSGQSWQAKKNKKKTHTRTDRCTNPNTYTSVPPLCLFVPTVIRPHQLWKRGRQRRRESPPSTVFQFTFQFQGALLARLCQKDARAFNMKEKVI